MKLPIKIDSFTGSWAFLSNFSPCEVLLDGMKYASVEAAYQASKTLDAEQREKFRYAGITPARAKRMGRSLKLRPDWEEVKIVIMRDLLLQKFRPSIPKRRRASTAKPNVRNVGFARADLTTLRRKSWRTKMYRRPENLDKRIDEQLFEKLMDIAAEESDAAYSFGSPSFHFERAVLSAAKRTLDAIDAKAKTGCGQCPSCFDGVPCGRAPKRAVKSSPSRNPRNRMAK